MQKKNLLEPKKKPLPVKEKSDEEEDSDDDNKAFQPSKPNPPVAQAKKA